MYQITKLSAVSVLRCAVRAFFSFALFSLLSIWQFSNKNMCAESRHTHLLFNVVDFLQRSGPTAVAAAVEKSWNRPIALHLHAQPNNIFVRFIRPISHCFRASIDTYMYLYTKRKYYFEYPLCASVKHLVWETWTVLKCKRFQRAVCLPFERQKNNWKSIEIQALK